MLMMNDDGFQALTESENELESDKKERKKRKEKKEKLFSPE